MPTPRKFSFRREPIAKIAIFYCGFTAIWIAAIIAVWKMGVVPESLWPWLRTVIWLGATLSWITWRRPVSARTWLGIWPISSRQLSMSIAGFAIILGWNLARANFLFSSIDQAPMPTPDLLAWSFVGVFVEELLFRGVIQTKLEEDLSPVLAILITALLFLAIHIPGWMILSISLDGIKVISILIVGLICGIVRHWSKSLWPAVAIHWANNLGARL